MNMHPNEPTQINPNAVSSTFLPYFVVVADLSSSDHDEHIDAYHIVFTCAADEYDALEQSRNARNFGGGYAPLAAFSTVDLHEYIIRLNAHPLKPGESFNFTTGMTDVQATGERVAEGER